MNDNASMPNDVFLSLRTSLRASFSPATLELLQEATKADPDAQKISKILKLDPALAANVLALANTPHYGQAGKINDLTRAIVVLGINEILHIALSLSFHHSLNSILCELGFDVFACWRMIIWSALGAELVAQEIAPQEKTAAYLCTLIKDLALLIYVATYPEQCVPPQETQDTGSGSGYIHWHSHLPIDHTQLTAELLTEWNFPEPMIKAIQAHHELEYILDHPPLTQAVILGTRWAEVEFRLEPEPDILNELDFLLSKVGAWPSAHWGHWRQKCTVLFENLCAQMNIVQLPHRERLYTHSVQTMQAFYSQAKEVESITEGLRAVAICVAKHLRWNWNISDALFEFYDPHADGYQNFFMVNGTIKVGEEAQAQFKDSFVSSGLEKILQLKVENKVLGKIHLLPPSDQDQARTELHTYMRLLSKSFARYLETIGPLEQKATMLDILPIGIALLDAQGVIIRTNDLFTRYLTQGVRPGLSFATCLNNNGLEASQRGWLGFLHSETETSHCIAHCHLGPLAKTTTDYCFILSSHKIKTDLQTSILVLAQDLSEIRVLEFEALGQRDFLTHLLASMQDLAFTVDQSGLITFASGQHGSYLKGKNLFQVARPLRTYTGPWNMEYLARSTMAVEAHLDLEDEHLILELIFSKFSHGSDYGLIVGRNISNIRRLEHKIKEQALFDALTQVFNRHHLEPMLEREIRRARRTGQDMGMIFFDIDKFKNFNDIYGHHVGDQALRVLGQIMRTMLRAGQDYPCRFGGDEFAIIVSDTSKDNLINIANRLQQEFRRQHDYKVSLSMGTSLLEPQDSVQTLLRRCDQANYQAKAQGGCCTVHLQTY